MFTGLIESMGNITAVTRQNKSITLAVMPISDNFSTSIGDSVAIDGVCLTVEKIKGNVLYFTAVFETLSKTTLAQIKQGATVNLERALMANGRLDGHIVLGHVDGIGKIKSDKKIGNSIIRTISLPENLNRFMVTEGSVAIDGISLTISEAKNSEISISLIPHTLKESSMGNKRTGDTVNIECDIIARYVEKMVLTKNKQTNNTDLRTLMERYEF